MLPEKAPIVEINVNNIEELWPCIVLAIRTSTFVALDTELSGLGSRKQLQAKDIEDRFKSISETANTRSILALGLSCFTFRGDKKDEQHDKVFLVQTFNILTLCTEEYVVEPGSVQFLVEHGFDFNKQYSSGVKYQRGAKDESSSNDKPPKSKKANIKPPKPYMKLLIEELVSSNVSIILHNALLDLVFIYSNFYCRLPNDLSTFVADLGSMFRGGIFDTKVIAEYKLRMHTSFLEYVYKKSLKENLKLRKHSKSSVVVEFLKYPEGVEDHLAWVDLSMPEEKDGCGEEGMRVLCKSFSNHGWCVNGTRCKNSHNVDLMIRTEGDPSKRKFLNSNDNPSKKAKKEAGGGDDDSSDRRFFDSMSDSRMHMAGFDAFMTGYSMAVFITKYCSEQKADDKEDKKEDEKDPMRWPLWGSVPDEFRDKIYLSGKDFPLPIALSTFAKESKDNVLKLKRIRGDD